MYICICNKVSDRQIRQAVANGALTLDHLRTELKVGSNCGRCRGCAKQVLHQALDDMADQSPLAESA